MSFASRTQATTLTPSPVQDTMPDSQNFDNEGENLSATQAGTTKTLGYIVGWLTGLTKLLGESGRRKNSDKFHGPDVTLDGTFTSVGTTVTGSGTKWNTAGSQKIDVGDIVAGTANEYREVATVISDTSLTLTDTFTVDVSSPATLRRIQTLAERLNVMIFSGGKTGRLMTFVSNTVPPQIEAGTMETKMKYVDSSATVAVALTQAYKNSSRQFRPYTWYNVFAESNGDIYFAPSCDAQSGTAKQLITASTSLSISVASNNASVTGGTLAIGTVAVGDIVLVRETDGWPNTISGVYIVESVSGTTSFTFKTNAANGTYTGGSQIPAWPHLQTLHGGTGSLAAVQALAAGVSTYSPSPNYEPVYSGYYVDENGLPGYGATGYGTSFARIEGCFYTDASAHIVDDIITYGVGRNKNDNYAWFMGINATQYGSTDTKIVRLLLTTAGTKIWGSDYTVLDNATNATRFKMNTRGKVYLHGSFYNSTGSATSFGITLNSAALTTVVSSINDNTVLDRTLAATNTSWNLNVQNVICNNNDIVRFHTNGGAIDTTTLAVVEFGMNL